MLIIWENLDAEKLELERLRSLVWLFFEDFIFDFIKNIFDIYNKKTKRFYKWMSRKKNQNKLMKFWTDLQWWLSEETLNIEILDYLDEVRARILKTIRNKISDDKLKNWEKIDYWVVEKQSKNLFLNLKQFEVELNILYITLFTRLNNFKKNYKSFERKNIEANWKFIVKIVRKILIIKKEINEIKRKLRNKNKL